MGAKLISTLLPLSSHHQAVEASRRGDTKLDFFDIVKVLRQRSGRGAIQGEVFWHLKDDGGRARGEEETSWRQLRHFVGEIGGGQCGCAISDEPWERGRVQYISHSVSWTRGFCLRDIISISLLWFTSLGFHSEIEVFSHRRFVIDGRKNSLHSPFPIVITALDSHNTAG